MARPQSRPGRTLALFFMSMAVAFGLVALTSTWLPSLGLDLRGGTRIQLAALGSPSQSSLREAASIVDSRVNDSGVSEATVTTDNEKYITVEIPGQNRADLVNTVKRQAQLRFRLVAQTGDGTAASSSASPSSSPGSGVLLPSKTAKASDKATTKPKKGKAGKSATSSASPSASAPASASDSASASASVAPSGTASLEDVKVADEIAWAASPPADWTKKFDKFTCPAPGEADTTTATVDNPTEPLLTCDGNGTKFLLSKALVEGTELRAAAAAPPDQNSAQWRVTLSFKGAAVDRFGEITTALFDNKEQFAVVLDRQVIEAAGVNEPILNGDAEISGGFTKSSAQSLATSLKYGALPIAFEKDPTTETIGPSLAGNQLTAGLWAGVFGLLLVMLYSMFYYRGLGLVIIASLLVAAAWTYALVLLLSKTAGFTLTLPGIAGLIVAVGITADSFIVYFERIRDEMRDGKSMRVAVEAGWARAKLTCLAADTVSLLAAVILYFFAAGVVKGFAFALGLSTLVDLLVFFWFTHPLMSTLARYPFFNKGHKLSGLDAENLGLDRLPAGGRA